MDRRGSCSGAERLAAFDVALWSIAVIYLSTIALLCLLHARGLKPEKCSITCRQASNGFGLAAGGILVGTGIGRAGRVGLQVLTCSTCMGTAAVVSQPDPAACEMTVPIRTTYSTRPLYTTLKIQCSTLFQRYGRQQKHYAGVLTPLASAPTRLQQARAHPLMLLYPWITLDHLHMAPT